MIVAALQPGYLPWIGFFDLMKRSDLFIVEDSLKYTKQDWRNRNRVRTSNGATYLTVPVQQGATGLPINEVQIDNSQPWANRQWNILETNYRRAPYWKQYREQLEDSLFREWDLLLDLDMHFIDFFIRELKLDSEYRMLSDYPVEFGPDKTKSLVELTIATGADTFLEGESGKGFLEESRFRDAGLRVLFQEYSCRPYRQQHEPFISHLSTLDLLLNEGPAGAALI